MLVLEEEDAERPLHSASVWVAACLFTLDPRVAPFHRYSTAIVSTFIYSLSGILGKNLQVDSKPWQVQTQGS